MPSVLNLYKSPGETPLARIERYRKEHPGLKNVPMSYAGRLDPMAEGVLLVLVGEENKKKSEYQALDKTYTTDILFGFATDTYDLLGVLTDSVTRASHKPLRVPLLLEYVSQMTGKRSQKYPPFSSKPFEGVPLFVKARKGELSGFDLPDHQVEIYEASLVGTRKVTDAELIADIEASIALVKGDFRQERILTLWRDTVRVLYGMSFDVATLSLRVSSGTYIRSLAHELGEKLGTPALAMHIVRSQVGKWKLKQSER